MSLRGTGSRANGRKTIDTYGTWPSPIAADAVGGNSLRLQLVQAAGPWIYWSEGRPSEGGRVVIMRARSSGRPEELLPPPFCARSRVHEYGGGEFLVAGDRIFFVNDSDQQIYEMRPGGVPLKLTDEPCVRFADFALDESRDQLIAVAERHDPAPRLPENLLVRISLATADRGRVRDLVRGQDFYASPRLSPDGAHVAFIAWNLPDMPWDEAVLHVADLGADGSAGRPRRVAGGRGTAASEPLWMPGGQLLFLWDRTGFDNLYVHEIGRRVRASGG